MANHKNRCNLIDRFFDGTPGRSGLMNFVAAWQVVTRVARSVRVVDSEPKEIQFRKNLFGTFFGRNCFNY